MRGERYGEGRWGKRKACEMPAAGRLSQRGGQAKEEASDKRGKGTGVRMRRGHKGMEGWRVQERWGHERGGGEGVCVRQVERGGAGKKCF